MEQEQPGVGVKVSSDLMVVGKAMFWSFIITTIVIFISMIALIIWASRHLRKITKQSTKNAFRIVQYSFFLYSVVMVIVSFGIKFIDDFQMQNYPFFLHVHFSYYFAEITNIAQWTNFLTHIRNYK